MRASFYAGVAPRGLAVGDFNGDGSPDVAINAEGRSFTSQYVSRTGEFLLLLNDGRGGLGRMTARRTLRGTEGGLIAAGDAEGDGDLDVLLGTLFGAKLLLGNGHGAFTDQAFSTSRGLVSSLGFWSGGTGSPLVWALGNEQWGYGPRTDPGFGLLRPLEGGGFESTSLLNENGHALFGFESSLSAAIADYNEDGFADVVFNFASSSTPEQAQVFFGTSTGRFRAGGVLPWSGFHRVYTADFNRDGHTDLLASDAHFVRVYLGNGQGGFSESSSVELGLEVSGVAVVDLGTDALPDVVALHGAAAAVSLLKGGGDGTLATHGQLAVGRAPSSAATSDLDGDGTRELLVVEADDNAVSVYAIPDKPVHEPPISYWCPVRPFPEGSSSLPHVSPLAEVETGGAVLEPAVGDFDADGRWDVALALPTRGVRLVLNPGGGPFTTRDVLQDHQVVSLAAGDFDGDGRSDLAASLRDDGGFFEYSVRVLWNDEEYPFEDYLHLGYSDGASGVLAADFNSDGRADLAASFQGTCVGRAARYTNQGNGTFLASELMDHNFEPDDRCPRVGAPLAGDFNGDGTLDLLHDTLGLSLNPTAADGSTLPGYGFGGGGTNLGLSDVDGDGRVDLVQRDWSNGGVWLHLGDGHGSLKSPVQCSPPVGNKTLTLEDLDGDGRADVAGTSTEGTELWVSLGDGQGRWGSPRLYVPGGAVEWVKPVDLLGDERPELLVLLRSGRLLVFPTPQE
ncbi:VCBS repeat protein [Archangium gephyra]|uniref:VCBS repeat protein n=1 Tax=Archangium gephyra TaxID=48 RepID=A0AAC8Q8H4_9BACT|nr:VCBS repeat-containing protein [Archangium gephyra]AKJ02980.1 Hypothetical protein AA314_04606 [Archangium gephyra]REG25103.1 VCBS repeat protein [Archangium gephyra]